MNIIAVQVDKKGLDRIFSIFRNNFHQLRNIIYFDYELNFNGFVVEKHDNGLFELNEYNFPEKKENQFEDIYITNCIQKVFYEKIGYTSFSIVKINKYNSFNNPIVCQDNYSTINDRLVRLSAKITESYAGDIFYVMQELEKLTKEKEEFTKILVFREHGVDCYTLPVYICNKSKLGIINLNSSEEIQTWVVRGRMIDDQNKTFQVDMDRIYLY